MPRIDPVDEFATPPRIPSGPTGPEEWDGTFETIYGVDRVESVLIDGTTIDAQDHAGVGDLSGCLISDVQAHQLAVHLALAAGATLERHE